MIKLIKDSNHTVKSAKPRKAWRTPVRLVVARGGKQSIVGRRKEQRIGAMILL